MGWKSNFEHHDIQEFIDSLINRSDQSLHEETLNEPENVDTVIDNDDSETEYNPTSDFLNDNPKTTPRSIFHWRESLEILNYAAENYTQKRDLKNLNAVLFNWNYSRVRIGNHPTTPEDLWLEIIFEDISLEHYRGKA